MKRLPGLFNDSFDEVFKDPFFSRNMEYMKTDIREKDNTYILEVELPGYQKEDIHMELQNGYLSIQAAHHLRQQFFLAGQACPSSGKGR